MNITIFNKETGRIENTTSCAEIDIPLQYDSVTHSHIEGYYSDNIFYIVIENMQPMPMPPRPTKNHTFDWATKLWADTRLLPEIKDEKWEVVKSAREAAVNAPLATPYGTFDCDARARTSITDAVLLLKSLEDLGTPDSIDFTLADNSVITLTTAQMVSVGLLLGQKVQAAYTRARDLRAQIEAATTAAEIEAVEW